MLRRDPKANVAAANRAWADAGHEGAISDSVFYKIKRELGQSGGREPSPVKSEPKPVSQGPEVGPTVAARPRPNGVPAPVKPLGSVRPGDRERVLDRVEDRIDDIIVELKQLGGMEGALEALRKVRRVVVRSHGG